MSKLKKIIVAGLLLAMLIVFSRFLSIKTPLLVISFSFIPIMMSAIWLGPKYSTCIAALGDLIGALLFPFGSYFPGFTFNAALSGLIYGIFLYQKPNKMKSNKKWIANLVISSFLVLGIINIFIAAIWLQILYGKAYLVIVTTRVIAQAIMLPIQITVMYALYKFTKPFAQKYLWEED